jgi:hypothetical protein
MPLLISTEGLLKSGLEKQAKNQDLASEKSTLKISRELCGCVVSAFSVPRREL